MRDAENADRHDIATSSEHEMRDAENADRHDIATSSVA
jgi:hypothetical protein